MRFIEHKEPFECAIAVKLIHRNYTNSPIHTHYIQLLIFPYQYSAHCDEPDSVLDAQLAAELRLAYALTTADTPAENIRLLIQPYLESGLCLYRYI
jgi:hypothetical protein